MNRFFKSLVRPLLCWLLLQQAFVVALHHSGDHVDNHLSVRALAKTNTNTSTLSNLTSPEAIVSQALAALAEINKLRVYQPLFNKHEFLNGSELASKGNLAPPLDYRDVSTNTTLSKTKRQSSPSNSTTNSTSPGAYTIPPELAEAARILAEANTRAPEGNHSDVAAAMRQKYSHNLQDTNRPEKHQRPEGLLSKFDDGHEGNSPTLDKRDSGYWMVDMAQRGSAPYANPGYKVSDTLCLIKIALLT